VISTRSVTYRTATRYVVAASLREHTGRVEVTREIFENILNIVVESVKKSFSKTYARSRNLGTFTQTCIYNIENDEEPIYCIEYVAYVRNSEVKDNEIVLNIEKSVCLKVLEPANNIVIHGDTTLAKFIVNVIKYLSGCHIEPQIEVKHVSALMQEKYLVELRIRGVEEATTATITVDIGSRDRLKMVEKALRMLPGVSMIGSDKTVNIRANIVEIRHVVRAEVDVQTLLDSLSRVLKNDA